MESNEKKGEDRLYAEFKFRPTLIVGLGGLGTNIVRSVYWWINKLAGKDKLPPFVKIIGIDTDAQTTGKYMETLASGTQFFNIGGFSAARLFNAYKNNMDNPKLKYLKIFNQIDLKPGQIHRGAHGIPMIDCAMKWWTLG